MPNTVRDRAHSTTGTAGLESSGEPLKHQTDIARAAALIADPSRARILKCLADGRALPANALAAEAGIGAATASAHLAKLVEGALLTVEQRGRHRFYRLAGPDVSAALECLALIAPPLAINSLKQSNRAIALHRGRSCYDHLAGRLGVALMCGLLERGILTGHDGIHRADESVRDRPASYGHDVRYRLTRSGRTELAGLGIDTDRLPPRRPAIRYCVDWSEHQHHLAGGLGAVLTARLFALDWVRWGRSPRVVDLTDTGARGLERTLGVVLTDVKLPAGGEPENPA
ncbi:ArsR/SmtB family transcription factor [Streptomyces drozdowiczii]|uniref:Metalloregulator ArsR/SmtB family transcription factor n=1 Tax=Streptomyces drozdowiczii TaxID=202862 RepID=A0ABY6Q028_9ACTN|nr:metalloregulator ArsR/SmtB family transcription factor [Streptomyces drozdowiczii]MCX0241939.1 metalloregulator ArsR/SmtB family transcription factor [Streptomyces drozdowiczii]UZK57950.1 metalloregulator ArsR/SmtB family transcription factor [Streptomyces drozdowiczii]